MKRETALLNIVLITYPKFIDEQNENEEYETTLNSCTCSDFQKRQLPCKHIYKLAMILGEINSTAKNNSISSINDNFNNNTLNITEASDVYMYSTAMDLFKYLPPTLLVTGFIGGIILGITYPNITVSGYFTKHTEETFNYAIMLYTWIGCGLLSAVFIAIYEHLKGLMQLNSTLSKIYELEKNKISDIK